MPTLRNTIEQSFRLAIERATVRQTPDDSFESMVRQQTGRPVGRTGSVQFPSGSNAIASGTPVDPAIADVFDQIRTGLADAERLLTARYPRLGMSVSPDLAAAKLHLQNVVTRLT